MLFEMSDPVTAPIQLEAISKCYRIFQNPQDRFKQALLDRFHGVLGKKTANQYYREHWALRDVSFELQPGEAVGILGPNGAGKSTLLQIIAGTLEPTSGSVKTSGRITALLELGSGFNPEFTGRENVFLNAQILGMSREEALARFDDIASFADIGDFIDQPVKTYSSGMMMRLAFAVQTAFEPKVLIVDEALSVGDMFFQAKCMARISRLVDNGVSLLFVSHDLHSIRQVCKRAVLIDWGQVIEIGDARSVSDRYSKMILETYNIQRDEVVIVESVETASKPSLTGYVGADAACPYPNEAFELRAAVNRSGSFDARIISVMILKDAVPSQIIDFDDEVEIIAYVRFFKSMKWVSFGMQFRTLQGTNVCYFDTRLGGQFEREYEAEKNYSFSCRLRVRMQHGDYIIACGLSQPPLGADNDWHFLDVIPSAAGFKVSPRAGGMLDGYWAPNAVLTIRKIG
jgi:lipopolysaccharide transport system ATP-binding protein